MTAKDSTLIESVPSVAVTSKDLAVPAGVDLKSKPGYFGPPAPPAKIASLLRKPKMRTSGDQIPITPLEEPDLPSGSDRPLKPDDSLLNPGSTPVAPGDLLPGDMPAPDSTSLEPPSCPPPGNSRPARSVRARRAFASALRTRSPGRARQAIQLN